MSQLHQPRLAEIVSSGLREDILSGRLKAGDLLPPQSDLFAKYRVSLPTVREAIRILENEGLISVRRGKAGGAVVHGPSPERTAQIISMVLQTRGSTPADVSGALLYLEPICAGMCAAREDRGSTVVPELRAAIQAQVADFDDPSTYIANARRFHEILVSRCGNEPMIIVVGSLELIWSSHEAAVWSDDPGAGLTAGNGDSPMGRKTRQAALADHQKLLRAVEDGDRPRAVRLAEAHLSAARHNTLASVGAQKIRANLIRHADRDGDGQS